MAFYAANLIHEAVLKASDGSHGTSPSTSPSHCPYFFDLTALLAHIDHTTHLSCKLVSLIGTLILIIAVLLGLINILFTFINTVTNLELHMVSTLSYGSKPSKSKKIATFGRVRQQLGEITALGLEVLVISDVLESLTKPVNQFSWDDLGTLITHCVISIIILISKSDNCLLRIDHSVFASRLILRFFLSILMCNNTNLSNRCTGKIILIACLRTFLSIMLGREINEIEEKIESSEIGHTQEMFQKLKHAVTGKSTNSKDSHNQSHDHSHNHHD